MISKISLGAVQFGMDYGIANKDGKPSFKIAKNIIKKAKTIGISKIDTAQAYGDSESILGNIGVKEFKITTKIPSIPSDTHDIEAYLENILQQSFKNLKVNKIECLLVHDVKQLNNNKYSQKIYNVLTKYKEKGLIRKIGISIYDPSELDKLDNLGIFDVIQSPFNILDRRLKDSGWMSKLKDLGIEIQVRSIFLQGLLLMENDDRPSIFDRWDILWNDWDKWLKETKSSPLSACLNFVLNEELIDSIVLGVDSEDQLQEICNSITTKFNAFPDNIISNDINLINPILWSKLEKK